MPCQVGSAFRPRTSSITSSWDVSAGSWNVCELMPISVAALVLGADVGHGRGVIADEDEGEAGLDALRLQRFDPLAQLLAYLAARSRVRR